MTGSNPVTSRPLLALLLAMILVAAGALALLQAAGPDLAGMAEGLSQLNRDLAIWQGPQAAAPDPQRVTVLPDPSAEGNPASLALSLLALCLAGATLLAGFALLLLDRLVLAPARLVRDLAEQAGPLLRREPVGYPAMARARIPVRDMEDLRV